MAYRYQWVRLPIDDLQAQELQKLFKQGHVPINPEKLQFIVQEDGKLICNIDAKPGAKVAGREALRYAMELLDASRLNKLQWRQQRRAHRRLDEMRDRVFWRVEDARYAQPTDAKTSEPLPWEDESSVPTNLTEEQANDLIERSA
jgi:hypothetical protein